MQSCWIIKATNTHTHTVCSTAGHIGPLPHTQGMQMPIRIMGVVKAPNGNYRVMGGVIQAPPGLESIVIDAPDILEIPENKYQIQYKRCLGAVEAK